MNALLIKEVHCTHDQFPKYINCPPPTQDLKTSLLIAQLQPIAVCTLPGNKNNTWFIMDGKRRLVAIRELYETLNKDGSRKHDGNVLYVDHGVKTIEEAYAFQEQSHIRSENPISTYMAIHHALIHGSNYADISIMYCLPVGTVKAIDRKLSNCPQWAMQACVDGKITLSVMMAITHKKSDVQDALQKVLADNAAGNKKHPLTMRDVNSTARAFKELSVVNVNNHYGLFPTYNGNLLQSFPRELLVKMDSLPEAQMKAYLAHLLTMTED